MVTLAIPAVLKTDRRKKRDFSEKLPKFVRFENLITGYSYKS